MARLESPFDLSGTYSNLVVYKVGSNLYARRRSSLTGKRFHKDPAFAHSREKAKAFGEASRLAKTIYAALPNELKKKGLFGKLTAQVHKGLLTGKDPRTAIKEVLRYYEIGVTVMPAQKVKTVPSTYRKQQPKFLSSWQVTAKGKLQYIHPVILLYNQPNHLKNIHLIPDG